MQFLVFRNFLIISTALSLLLGCSEKKVPRVTHEPEIPSPAKTDDFKTDANKKNVEIFQQQLSVSNLETATKSLLSKENLANTEFTSDAASVAKLSALNSFIFNNWSQTGNEIKNFYVSQVFLGCNESLQGCVATSFFKRDSLTTKILTRLAGEDLTLPSSYRKLMMAFELKNAESNLELESAYLKKSAEYEAFLNSQKNTELSDRHRKIVGLLLQKSHTQNVDTKNLGTYGNWDINSKSHPLSRNIRDVLAVLAREKLYQDGSKKSLHPDFLKYIETAKSASDGLVERQKKILAETVKGLSLRPLGQADMDEYFYMIDRVYYEAISPQDMLVIFQESKKDLNRLADLTRRYIEIQMIATIIDANLAMAARLREQHVYPTILLDEAFNESRNIQTKVMDFLRKALAVQSFVEGAYQKQAKMMEEKDAFFFSSLKTSLKYSLTYPQMLALSFILSKKEFTKKITTSFGIEFEIKHAEILKSLFSGKFSAWFDYGHDSRGLSEHEILMTLEYALKTQVLTAFEVNPEEFIEKIMTTLLDEEIKKFKDLASPLDMKFRDDRWKTIQQICADLPHPPQGRFDVHIDSLAYYPLGGLIQTLTKNLYLYSAYYAMRIGGMAASQRPVQRRLSAVAATFENYLKAMGETPDSIATAVKKATTSLTELEKMQNEFIDKFLDLQKKWDGCYADVIRFDRNLQFKILSYEVDYIRQVHTLMKEVRSKKLTGDALAELNKKAKFYGVPNIPGFQSFDDDSFTYFFPDMYLRFKHYIEKGLGDKPALFPTMKVIVPDRAQASSFLSSNLFQKIDWEENADAFVARVLSAIGSDVGYQVPLPWMRENYSSRYELSYQQNANWPGILTTLYVLTPKMDLKEIIEQPFRINRAWGLDPVEEKWQRSIGRPFKMPMSFLSPAIIDDQNLEPKSPFEYILDVIGKPIKVQGSGINSDYAEDPQTEGQSIGTKIILYDEAEAFYRFVQNLKPLAFKTDIGFLDNLSNIYKTEVRAYDKRAGDLLSAIDKRYQDDLTNNSVLQPSYNLDQRYTGPYVKDGTRKNFEARRIIFHEATKNEFR